VALYHFSAKVISRATLGQQDLGMHHTRLRPEVVGLPGAFVLQLRARTVLLTRIGSREVCGGGVVSLLRQGNLAGKRSQRSGSRHGRDTRTCDPSSASDLSLAVVGRSGQTLDRPEVRVKLNRRSLRSQPSRSVRHHPSRRACQIWSEAVRPQLSGGWTIWPDA
jgi:hypothetical protein